MQKQHDTQIHNLREMHRQEMCIRDSNVTMRVITREALGIYIFAKPANQQERDFNARMMKKAVILRNQRYDCLLYTSYAGR